MLVLEMPEIKTKRLLLRPVVVEDAKDIFEYASDEVATAFVGFKTHQSIGDTYNTIVNSYLKYYEKPRPQSYAIVLKETGKVIGVCDCHTLHMEDVGEIGYIINPKYWGKGYASEAVQALIQVLFEVVGLRKLEALQATSNPASACVLFKAGFVWEGTSRKFMKSKTGSYLDMNRYSLLKEEYIEKRSKR